MHAVRRDLTIRALALIAMVLLSAGAVACGDSDDGGGAADASSESSASDERAAVAVLEEASQAMNARDYEAVCGVVTREARQTAKKWEGYPTCAQGMADALTDDPTGKDNVLNQDMPAVDGVEIKGDTALVSAKRGQKVVIARVKKEGDEWLMERWFSED
jgi:hypothetical protein